MSLFMDIGQGAGLSGASGVRPFLPALLAGALAREDTGLDFDGTDFLIHAHCFSRPFCRGLQDLHRWQFHIFGEDLNFVMNSEPR